jgi:hypothetical protein
MKRILALFPLLFLVACADPDLSHWDYSDIHGKVTQVRILQDDEIIVRDNDHPVAGAIIGHALIGGAKGAIIGAVLGSGDKTTTQTNEFKACELFITTTDGTVHEFHIDGNGDLATRCALAEPGDVAYVQRHWEHNSKETFQTYFSWECRSNWDYYSCAKEVQP